MRTSSGPPIWSYSLDVCQALGGARAAAEPSAAAILCLASSINLLDNILDDDPSKLLETLGPGRTANLAAALQSAAAQLLLTAPELDPEQRLASLHWLEHAAFGTARGQDLDTGDPSGILRRNRGDRGRTVAAKRSNRFDVGLNPGTAA